MVRVRVIWIWIVVGRTPNWDITQTRHHADDITIIG